MATTKKKDEPAMSGDGSDMAHMPAEDDDSIIEMREKGTLVKASHNGPLKIKGSFNDALRVLVGKKPKGSISTE